MGHRRGHPGGRRQHRLTGKTPRELTLAIAEGIGQINLESAEEAEMLSAIAHGLGRAVPVALRVNPDVDARTHAKITTGRSENKFGVDIALAPALYARIATLPGLSPKGLAVHIGSQITEGVGAFAAAYRRLGELVVALRAQGLPVTRVDCGGGLGISYRDETPPSPAAFAGAIRAGLGHLDLELMVEPGRWIAGPAGVLLASVLLFYLGLAFAYFVLLPAMFAFLTTTVPEGVVMTTDISAYLSFVLVMGLASGIAFEVPVAVLVAMIFMHLKYDWRLLYFLLIPVCIMAVMMMVVLLPDTPVKKAYQSMARVRAALPSARRR